MSRSNQPNWRCRLVCFAGLVCFAAWILINFADIAKTQLVRKQDQDIRVGDRNYDRWLASFRATDPDYQEFCEQCLHGKGCGSQFGQDMFLFHNFFKHWPIQGKRGFYVDSGANHYKSLSNTLFYDKCLGWQGLCVEPNTEYHDGLRKHRSCALIAECISDRHAALPMTNAGEGSQVANASTPGTFPVKCAPLLDMLTRSGDGLTTTSPHIDLWSLDVEGHEMTVLNAVDFKQIDISVVLIEEFWLSTRELDMVMNRNGFYKYHQLPIDGVYAKRSMHGSESVWYPESWDYAVNVNRAFRDQMKASLRC